MIKRIIFDLDNTLIMWDDKWYQTLNDTLKYFNIPITPDFIDKVNQAVDEYENNYDNYKYEYMDEMFNKNVGVNIPAGFSKKWSEFLELAVPEKEDPKLINTLEYLSSKYELVVLTNWFTYQQKKRLENYNILKYFKEIIGTDLVKNKPNKEAYLKALGPYKIDECIMVGDSLEIDIKGANKLGIRSILVDYKNNYNGNNENIKHIYELEEIL